MGLTNMVLGSYSAPRTCISKAEYEYAHEYCYIRQGWSHIRPPRIWISKAEYEYSQENCYIRQPLGWRQKQNVRGPSTRRRSRRFKSTGRRLRSARPSVLPSPRNPREVIYILLELRVLCVVEIEASKARKKEREQEREREKERQQERKR